MTIYDQEAASWGFDLKMKDPSKLASLGITLAKERWKRHIDDVKMTFGVFERAFSNPSLSEASRENLLHLSRMLQSSLTPIERVALAGIGSLRMLSPEEMKAREFDKRFPKPKPPMGKEGELLPHSPENNGAWARYYIELAERARKRAIAIYGVEKGREMVPLPRLFQTDVKNVYAYRNPLTNSVGMIHLKEDIPEGLLARALESKKTTLSEIVANGGFPDPDEKPRVVYYDGGAYSIEPYFDIISGGRGIRSKPIGPAPQKELPSSLRNVMMAFEIEDEDKRKELLKSPEEAGLYESLKRALEFKEGSPERSAAFAKIRQQLLMMYPEGGWVPFPGKKLKGGFWNFIPGKKDVFYLEDSGVIWRRVNGVKEYLDANGERFRVYTTPGGNIVDGSGNDVPAAKGRPEGSVVPNVVVRKPQVRKMTVRETVRYLEDFTKRQLKLDTADVKKIVQAYQKSFNERKGVIDLESFRKALEDAEIAANVINEIFLYRPWRVLNQIGNEMINFVGDLPVPGTWTEE